MKRLFVLFDATCALCLKCRNWMMQQPAFVEIQFIPLQSPELEMLFPGIGAIEASDQLVAISDEGNLYQGPHAWIICLYALREYREWSQRLANPLLLPFAKRAFEMLSTNRYALSRWITSEDQAHLRKQLESHPARACDSRRRCV